MSNAHLSNALIQSCDLCFAFISALIFSLYALCLKKDLASDKLLTLGWLQENLIT